MTLPLFSLIIPSYNSDRTISRCFNSIISQTKVSYEIIVVDGGSSDDSIEIIRTYSRKCENLVWSSEKDKGIYDAMNKGIKIAKGEWLFFLGSDDQFFDNVVLEKVSKEITENPKCKVFYGNSLIIGEAGWAKNEEIYAGEFSTKKLLTKNISHQAIFYHKSVFESLKNYNLKYKTCADYDFNLRAWARYPFCYKNILISKFYSGGFSSNKLQDIQFSNDFCENVISYFKRDLYKKEFEVFEFEIIKQAKKQFARFKILSSLYLFSVFYSFKIKRKFKINA